MNLFAAGSPEPYHDERRQRRGGGKVLDEAALAMAASSSTGSPLAHVLDAEPTPDFAAQVADAHAPSSSD